jgi:Ras-related GTP-binding protein A/B
MDLVPKEQRDKVFEANRIRITQISLPLRVMCFQTSIWHDTLYRAWSTICASLVPHAELIQDHLEAFCDNANVEEVVLFEKATFLDIAHSSKLTPEGTSPFRDIHRFEKISNIIKMFKLSCLYVD